MTPRLVGRFRFTDAPCGASGLRMRPLTEEEQAELAEAKAGWARVQSELSAAYREVQELEQDCRLMPSNVHRKADLEKARLRLNALRFVWEDRASEPKELTLPQQLKAYNERLRKFWERQS